MRHGIRVDEEMGGEPVANRAGDGQREGIEDGFVIEFRPLASCCSFLTHALFHLAGKMPVDDNRVGRREEHAGDEPTQSNDQAISAGGCIENGETQIRRGI